MLAVVIACPRCCWRNTLQPLGTLGWSGAGALPLCIEQRQVCIERALPCPEDVTSIAPKDLADTIATVAGFTNDLLDGRAILGERHCNLAIAELAVEE
jgi:hypothetical protein